LALKQKVEMAPNCAETIATIVVLLTNYNDIMGYTTTKPAIIDEFL
jgi:hypothetical protein